MDPQIIFSLGRDRYLEELEYIPSRVDVLEIQQFGVIKS
jgi:hypothetical protein